MRILIIEDEPKIAHAIKRGLEQERYAADVCGTGPSGLAAAQAEDYDLVILDRMLPGMDGLTICKELRRSGKNTPILMLTAKDTVQDRVDGLKGGADDYLIKPFAFSELVARCQALLRRPPVTIGNTLEVDDLQLDMVACTVTRSGKDIALSQKEWSLLEYLIRNKGRLITKDALIAHVWDDDADILPNTVEVYIGYLRQKIDRPFPKRPNLIQTVRGFGYKVEDIHE